MNIINIKELISNRTVLIGVAVSIVILGASLVLTTYSAEKAQKNKVVEYDYDAVEQQLADEVKAYLSKYLAIPEQTSCDIADIAVQNYNIVMSSETDVINDEITEAVKSRIRSTMVALIDQPEIMTEKNLDALSSGVTEIIWNTVLEQLAKSDLSRAEEYREEYLYLSQSLQEQIDSLKERKTKVSINANIIDNTEQNTELTGDELLAGIKSMSDEELQIMAEKLGISVDELNDYIEATIVKSNEDISEDFEKELLEIKKELQKEISSTAGKTGATGKTGARGEKGEQGVAGKDGSDGKDGKTTYIAYADDVNGTNFSLTPTETSKYVGTCITDASIQPNDPTLYSNWQEYRAYVITATTDADTGVTTVHIN